MKSKNILKDIVKKVNYFSLFSRTLVLTCFAPLVGGARSFVTKRIITFLTCIWGIALYRAHLPKLSHLENTVTLYLRCIRPCMYFKGWETRNPLDSLSEKLTLFRIHVLTFKDENKPAQSLASLFGPPKRAASRLGSMAVLNPRFISVIQHLFSA